MKLALFVFRRDLRIQDNRGLQAALKMAKKVIPAFIFNPEQIENNPYKSQRCFQFMIESLEELNHELHDQGSKLYYFQGKPEEIITKCISMLGIQGVFVNRDYTPYSIIRDEAIEKICTEYSIVFHAEHDLLLQPVEAGLKKNGKPYTMFTPFFRHASKFEVALPTPTCFNRLCRHPITFSQRKTILRSICPNRQKQAQGGRSQALNILKNLTPSFTQYENEKNYPAFDKTTHLSAHLKFTTCSVREIYQFLKIHGELMQISSALFIGEIFSL